MSPRMEKFLFWGALLIRELFYKELKSINFVLKNIEYYVMS